MASNRALVYDHDALPETCREDGHIDGCPGMAGGDHELAFRWSRTAPKTDWCWLCRRATEDSVTVDTEYGPQPVCPDCWARDWPLLPLTYEDVGEDRDAAS